MATLLYIQASPRGARSFSVAAADAFLARYKELNPDDTITAINLFERDLPPFDGMVLQAKYAVLHGQQHTAEELAAWRAVEALVAEFKAADKYVFAVPMWNFGVPYRLKHYLDLLVQPGLTFSYSPDQGYKGLVPDRPVFIAYARGGEYRAGSPAAAIDHQMPYFDMILGFIGLTRISKVVVEPTLAGGPQTAAAKRQAAIESARQAAGSF